jgi:uncharacterized protein (DUF1800 family)
MPTNRKKERQSYRVAANAFALLVCLLSLSLVPAQASGQNHDSDEDIRHLLNRITYGPTRDDLELVRKEGVEHYIDQQLNPESLKESETVLDLIGRSDGLCLLPQDLFDQYGDRAAKYQLAKDASDDEKKAINKLKNDDTEKIYNDAVRGKIISAVDSPRQLVEVMTDFWYNHFNIYRDKNQDRILVGAFERQALRPFALGKFRDLLGATAHHPAMLVYLDNWQNTGPKPGAKGRFAGLNENYARELMELHTLGVDGGYKQKDVTELARVLTGLGLPPDNRSKINPRNISRFGSYFDDNRHDQTEKIVLGKKIEPRGQAEVEEALDMLAKSHATAKHIAFQLAQYFVADDPPKSLVNRLADKFKDSDGDIRVVMRALLESKEFWQSKYYDNKFKTPFRFVASALRSTGELPDDTKPLAQFLREQGMPTYYCLTPDGYKNTEQAWLNPDSLLRRLSFACNLGQGKIGGLPKTKLTYESIMANSDIELSANTKAAVEAAKPDIRVGLVLGSPEFMYY